MSNTQKLIALSAEATAALADATLRVFGHDFRPMDDTDYVGLSGAEPGSHVCELEDRILVLNPNGSVTEILADGSEYVWSVTQR